MKAVQYRRFRDEVVSHYEAMGAARRAEIDRVEASLRKGNSVILTGHAGIGKSYVAAGLVARVTSGSRAADNEPLLRCSRSRDVERLRELGDNDDGGNGVLTIEDAHLLEVHDLRILVDIVGNSGRTFLITMDVDPLDSLHPDAHSRSKLVTSLWADMGLERVDLSGIGFNEASALIDQVCGNEGMDVVTRARIVHAADGNPLLLTELTREALGRSGGIGVDSASLILGPITLSPRILDLTAARISGLSDVDEYALITLAKIGPVPYVRATRLVGQAPLRSLLRRGLVVHEPGSLEYVSASVLYANAAQANRHIENPLEAAHTVELLLLAEYRAGLRLTSVECTIIAAYWTNNPLVDPTVGLPAIEAAEILARAASRADLWGLPASGEMFARRSLALAPGVHATEQLSRALAGQGLNTAAIEVLENERLVHQDQFDDASLFAWWYMLFAWHDFDAERGAELRHRVTQWGTIDALMLEFDEVTSLRRTLLDSEYADGIAPLAAFAANESRSYANRLRALAELIPAYTFLGRPHDMHDAFELGRDLVDELTTGGAARSLGDPTAAAAIFLSTAGLAKVTTGDDRAGLTRDLDVYALRAVLAGNELELALVNLVSGALSLSRSRPARGEVELARAEVGISRRLEPTATVAARLLRGNALCALGRQAEARELLDSFTDREIRATPWTEFYARFLEITLVTDPNNLATARDALLALARFKDGRSRPIMMATVYGAMIAGAPAAQLVELMDSIGASGKSEVADAVEELLRALVADDAVRLDAVGSWFEKLGMSEQSALAFQNAGTVHLSHGNTSDAALSYEQRDTQTRQFAPAAAAAPAPAPTVSSENIARLTRRELEIAQLAGLGLSNSEIAARLFLSVRTVESHVLQARVKLGASRRSELGLYLADFDRQAS